MTDQWDDGWDDSDFDYPSWFNESECTCKHKQEDHSWTGCQVEGCECAACWEE